MKFILKFVLVVGVVATLTSSCAPRYHKMFTRTFYITDACYPESADRKPMKNQRLKRLRRITWVNTTDTLKTLWFANKDVFGFNLLEFAPHSIRVTVLVGEKNRETTVEVKDCNKISPLAPPKVKVGEDKP